MAAGGPCGLCPDRLQLGWVLEVQTHEVFLGLSPVRSGPVGLAGYMHYKQLQPGVIRQDALVPPKPSPAISSLSLSLSASSRQPSIGVEAPALTLVGCSPFYRWVNGVTPTTQGRWNCHIPAAAAQQGKGRTPDLGGRGLGSN